MNIAKGWCLQDVVCAGPLPWHCPDATQQLLQCVSLLLRNRCSFLFQTLQRPLLNREGTYLVSGILRLKPHNKALYVPLFLVSSALLCRHTAPHFCRGLGILMDQFCNLCPCPLLTVCEGSTFVLRWTVRFKSQRGNSEP